MKKTLSNRSKDAPTWVGGHTQDLKPQHLPNYAGHIPGKDAENMYGRTYGATTAEAIAKEHIVPRERETENRFTTTAMAEYNPTKLGLNDRAGNSDLRQIEDDKKEYEGYFGLEHPENYYIPEPEPRPIDLLPTSGYKGHKSLYKGNLYKVPDKNNPFINFNVGPLTAKLKKNIYQNVEELPGYDQLDEGFKKVMQKKSEQAVPDTGIKLPTVGYTGHRPGNEAQSFFGKSY